MEKKYYLMFEKLDCISYSSRSFASFDDAREVLEMMRAYNDPTVVRLAVGYWEETYLNGRVNLKLFHICAESRRISK